MTKLSTFKIQMDCLYINVYNILHELAFFFLNIFKNFLNKTTS